MRKLFERIQDRLRGFVEQRDDLALVVRCEDFEAGYLMKMLQAIAESNDYSLFWMFAEPFDDPVSYADAVMRSLSEQHGAVCQQLEEEGEESWPPLPERLSDRSLDPALRIRESMAYCRSLLPDPEGQLSVFVHFPTEIRDAAGYARLVAGFVAHEFPNPWCHHMRVFLREDEGRPILSEQLANAPRVDFFAPDLSPEAMENEVAEELGDPQIPLDQRVFGLLTLGARDSAHMRYEQAAEKFSTCFRYFRANEDHVMTALTLNCMGEMHIRAGGIDTAQDLFEKALTPAIESENNLILLIVTLSLGNLQLTRQDWPEAESYYDSAEKLARAMCNPQTTIQALNNLGYCQYAQGKVEEALESWNGGATLARSMEEKDLLPMILGHLAAHHERYGPRETAAELRRELDELARESRAMQA